MNHACFRFLFMLVAGCAATTGDGTAVDGDGSGGDGVGSGDQESSAGASADQGPDTAYAPTTWKVLDHDYQAQQTGYWCGPASTRIALSTRGAPPSQQTLANEL